MGNSHHISEDLRLREERAAGDDAPQSITTEEESRRPKTPLRSRRHLPDAAGWYLHNPTLQTEEKTRLPRPPAAGAAGGGRGTRRFVGVEVDWLVDSRKRPCEYCSEGKGPGSLY